MSPGRGTGSELAGRPQPAWLGIGAQRCGTTWVSDLLRQHPKVRVAGKKELHALYRPFIEPWGPERAQRYQRHFEKRREGFLYGEWTPYYLRAPWVPEIVRDVVDESVPIFVLLRDPVERYVSAIRHTMEHGPAPKPLARWIRLNNSDATWGGMYASQLEVWASVIGRDRLVVRQFEKVRQDPQAALDELWGLLGVDPVPLEDVERPSRWSASHVEWGLDALPGMREQLVRIYRPEVERLTRWGVDPALWPNFAE